MYNEDQKNRFIWDYAKNKKRAFDRAMRLFNAAEPVESETGKDLCAMSDAELQMVLDRLPMARGAYADEVIQAARDYGIWCQKNKVPDAREDILHIQTDWSEQFRNSMVSSPLHLQRWLNVLFDPESEQTVDNIYRAVIWAIYGGAFLDEISQIMKSDVDLPGMRIHGHYGDITLYPEGLPSIRNTLELDTMRYEHPLYREKITNRPRIPGNELFRGFRSVYTIPFLRTNLIKRSHEAIKNGKRKEELTFSNVWLSGIFYRAYQNEVMGIPVTFTEAASQKLQYSMNKENAPMNQKIAKRRLNHMIRSYKRDYERWKLAFSLQ